MSTINDQGPSRKSLGSLKSPLFNANRFQRVSPDHVSNMYISPQSKRNQSVPGGTKISFDLSTSSPSINNDEAEKKNKRVLLSKSKESEQSSSIGTTPNKKTSFPIGNLTQKQLTNHYSDCMKLLAENKITSKNAFSLHLIDIMSDILKDKDGTDFQMASSTIDASARIYAGRVDSIHSDTYKMLSGLSTNRADEKEANEINESLRNNDESYILGDGEDDGGGDRIKKQEKKKKKMNKKRNVVETNLKNINNTKMDIEFEVDPFFQKSMASFDEGSISSLLLYQLRTYSISGELIHDSNRDVENISDISNVQNIPTTKLEVVKNLKDILKSINRDDVEICPSARDFQFLNTSDDTENFVKSYLEQSSNQSKLNPFQFDAEAEPFIRPNSPGSEDNNFRAMNDDNDQDHFSDNGYDDNHNKEKTGSLQMSKSSLLDVTITNMKSGAMSDLKSMLSTVPSDYSYFKQDVFMTWAGPNNWKLKGANKENQKGQQREKKKTKKRETFTGICFNDEDEEAVMKKIEWHFKVTKAKTASTKEELEMIDATYASKNQNDSIFSMLGSKEEMVKTEEGDDTEQIRHTNINLPKEMLYEPKSILALFLIPEHYTKNIESSNILDISNYNYDNANDRENYCPLNTSQTAAGHARIKDYGSDTDDNNENGIVLENNDDLGQEGYGIDQTQMEDNSNFNLTCNTTHKQLDFDYENDNEDEEAKLLGNNLIPHPRKIAKIDINYAKTAKNIDIKRVKVHMSEFLSKELLQKNLGSEDASEASGNSKQATFLNVLKKTKSSLSKSLSESLSDHVGFVCLLHLANEQNLRLKSLKDFSDLVITKIEKP